jgi:hypothetical protein
MLSETVINIKKTFSIESDDLKEIRKELIKKMASVYPTTETGEFVSEYEKTQYFQIYKAIEKIDAEIDSAKALICVDDLRKSLNIIQENDSRKEIVKIEQQRKLDKQIETSIANYKAKLFFPKITLTTITTILFFILSFPSVVMDHPILKQIFYTYNFPRNEFELNFNFFIFSVIWFYILIFTLYLWIITAVNGSKKKNLYSKLQFETNQNELFNNFLESGEFLDSNTFLKINFIDFLLNESENEILGKKTAKKLGDNRSKKSISTNSYISVFSLNPPLMDYEIADAIADIILTKALNKKLIKIQGASGLEDIYMVCSDTPNN